MKKVLIVSYYFPPVNMIASKRYGTMCRYFEKYGYKPYIVTTKPDMSCCWEVGFDLGIPVPQEQIIRIGRMKDNIRTKKWYVTLLLKMMEKLKIQSRTVTASSLEWYRKVKEEINPDLLQGTDIIIGTFPPMENLFVAKYLSAKLGCPYVAEVRDLISDYAEMDKRPAMGRIIDFLMERRYLGPADGIISVTAGFRKALKKRYPDKPHKVIYNGWDQNRRNQSVKDQEKNACLCEGGRQRYLYYAGSFYQHRLESFELLVKCIRKANAATENKFALIVRSIGPKELDRKAKKIVEREQMADYVKILNAVSEDIVRAEQEGASINIILGSVHDDNRALMATVPGKLYELMRESAPVLAIAPEHSEAGRLLGYTKKGITSVSSDEIVAFILHNSSKYTGNGNIQYFSRKRQAKRVCGFLDDRLDGRTNI